MENNIHWTQMIHYQQQFQKLSRCLLSAQKLPLTPSECELLAWLYFHPEENTAQMLVQKSGMKKEAVSRCLKNLYKKECLSKSIDPSDERHHLLYVTEQGKTQLSLCYEKILQPFYTLLHTVGDDFEQLLQLIDRTASTLSTLEKEDPKK